MEESGRPSFGGGGGERRLELIVSGKGYNYKKTGNQIYSPRTPVSPPRPPPMARPNQVASSSSSSSKPCWGFSDPETKRRKRIARYKVYSVEGRMKASIRNGFRWIKNKCSEIIHGY
ncbi:hypothetical protein ACJIZ3_011597 [Penstemon smallii]|uniref:DUF3511 domain protein n=1 Tax=Penstemon smallii TaxID=265156 RepID=A0ABD3UN67_9LAMI